MEQDIEEVYRTVSSGDWPAGSINLRSLRGSCSDDDTVFEGVILFQGPHELSDRASLLSDGAVNTEQLLRLVIALVPALLVQDGIERDSSLAGLTCRCKLHHTV